MFDNRLGWLGKEGINILKSRSRALSGTFDETLSVSDFRTIKIASSTKTALCHNFFKTTFPVYKFLKVSK